MPGVIIAYDRHTDGCPYSDVDRCIMVGRQGEPAMQAYEVVPVLTVPLGTVTTCRASAAGVARIDEDDRDALPLSLVTDELPQLVERPSLQARSLLVAEPFHVLGDAREVFEGDPDAMCLCL